MDDADRETAVRREKGRGLVRALYVSELETARQRRRAALKEADEQLDKVAKLLPDALSAGLTLSEVARLSDVSRPTLYQLRGRYSDDARDIRIAVLQTVANVGKARRAEVVEQVRRPDEVTSLIDRLIEQGFLDEDFNDEPQDPAMEVWLTDKGFDLLEHWVFEEHEEDAE
jgi:hypothetical protein